MANKKVIKKVKNEDDQVVKVKVDKRAESMDLKAEKEAAKQKRAEDIDAFKLDQAPSEEEGELSEIEQEIKEEEGEAFEEEIQEERYYTVPLAKGVEKAPAWMASKKAMRVLQAFLTRHMKPEGEVYISQDVNYRIWEKGIKHPPRKIRVRVTKSVDGVVRAYLA